MMLKPALRPPLRVPVRGTNAPREGVGALNTFSPLRKAIQADAADVAVVVIGDSLSNDTGDWVYLFAGALGDLYPTHTVRYRLWSDASGDYGASSNLTTGSGSHVIDIYNCSVGGSNVSYVDAGRLTKAVTDIDPDLVIWAHGKSGWTSDAVTLPEWKGTVDNVRLRSPHANVAYVLEPPNRDDTAMDGPVAAWSGVLRHGDEALIDMHAHFVAAGKPSGWYTDNLHPNATGAAEMVDVALAAWNGSRAGDYPRLPAWFETQVENFLLNGALASSGTSVPTSWTTIGTVASSREGTIVFPGDADSLKLQGSGAAQAGIRQQITDPTKIAAMAGKTVTLTVVKYIPAGAVGTVGRIGISSNGTGTPSITSQSSTARRDGWVIDTVSLAIPANANTVTPTIYHDSAAAPDTDPVYVARAVLSLDAVPRDTL